MRKHLLFLLLFLLPVLIFAQSKQAERLYKAGNFSEAIPFLENELKAKNNLIVKTKLAYCYRMTNQNAKALKLYSELAQKERVRSDVFLYYGEALMMAEQYDSASIYFNRYTLSEPKDERGQLLISSLEKLKEVKALFPESAVAPFQHNSDADDSAPVMFRNGMVFASDRNTGFKPLKEKSGVTGRDYLNLYYTDFQKDTIFDTPEWFSSKINTLNKNTGSISFTSNHKAAFFAQNSTTESKNKVYNLQIFKTESDGKSWNTVELLPFNTPEMTIMHPAISGDGTELFFASDRAGGQGGTDIYRVKRNNRGVWGALENLGTTINTSASEGFPYMDRAGRLYFCSKGHASYGGFDIFMSEKNEVGQWKTPVNLGKPINSPADDISFHLFIDGLSGMFTSNREGSDDDIYFFYPKDSLNFLSKEVEFHRPMVQTIDIQQKDTSTVIHDNSKEEAVLPKEQKTEAEKQEEIKDIPKVIVTAIENNLDSFIVQLRKTKSDSTFKIKDKTTFLLKNIHFDDKMELDSLSKNELNILKNLLDSFPISVQILVHTAAKGKEKYNLERSKKQGLRIVKYLTEKGINRERLRSKGMGETQPRCGKDCQERFGLEEDQTNERIEIEIRKVKI